MVLCYGYGYYLMTVLWWWSITEMPTSSNKKFKDQRCLVSAPVISEKSTKLMLVQEWYSCHLACTKIVHAKNVQLKTIFLALAFVHCIQYLADIELCTQGGSEFWFYLSSQFSFLCKDESIYHGLISAIIISQEGSGHKPRVRKSWLKLNVCQPVV